MDRNEIRLSIEIVVAMAIVITMLCGRNPFNVFVFLLRIVSAIALMFAGCIRELSEYIPAEFSRHFHMSEHALGIKDMPAPLLEMEVIPEERRQLKRR